MKPLAHARESWATVPVSPMAQRLGSDHLEAPTSVAHIGSARLRVSLDYPDQCVIARDR